MFSNSVARPLVSPSAFVDVLSLECKCREKGVTLTLHEGACDCTDGTGATERRIVPAEYLSSWSDFHVWLQSVINESN